jgi:hypothetical protein
LKSLLRFQYQRASLRIERNTSGFENLTVIGIFEEFIGTMNVPPELKNAPFVTEMIGSSCIESSWFDLEMLIGEWATR